MIKRLPGKEGDKQPPNSHGPLRTLQQSIQEDKRSSFTEHRLLLSHQVGNSDIRESQNCREKRERGRAGQSSLAILGTQRRQKILAHLYVEGENREDQGGAVPVSPE